MTPAAPQSLELPSAPRAVLGRRLALALVCLFPLLVSVPTLGDRFATAEDALNAAIWGLGARNLLHEGWSASKRGAVVAPDPGTLGNGVYAHHPPLSVWVMTVPVALGGWEGGARLIALLCAAATLALLAKVLARFFEAPVALAAVSAIAASGFLLHSARMLTTLTLSAPLFFALLDAGLTWRETGRLPRWASPVAALLVLSAWDGFLGAGALGLAALLSVRGRPWRQLLAPALCALFAALFVAWHLIDATGGTRELAWQASWRANAEVGPGEWCARQLSNLLPRLGPLTLAALVAAPMLWRGAPRGALGAMAIAAVPGLGMLLLFRQGAAHHAFWGYQLVLPAAFALALGLSKLSSRARPFAFAALAAQAVGLTFWSAQQLSEEHTASSAAKLVSRHFTNAAEVPMFSSGKFHPWVPWNTGARPEVSQDVTALGERLAKGEVQAATMVLADTRFLTRLECRPVEVLDSSTDGRWALVHAGDIARACAAPAPGGLR